MHTSSRSNTDYLNIHDFETIQTDTTTHSGDANHTDRAAYGSKELPNAGNKIEKSNHFPVARQQERRRKLGVAPVPVLIPFSSLPTLIPSEVGGFSAVGLQEQEHTKADGMLDHPEAVMHVHDSLPDILDQQQKTMPAQKGAGKTRIKLALRVLFTLILFAFLLKSFSWSELLVALQHVHHVLLLIALSVGVCGLVISCYQWRSLLYGEKIHADLAVLIRLYLVGVAFSHFLPTSMGGDAVKALYIGRDSGNHPGSGSAVIMSRVTGFFGMLFIAIPTIVIWHTHFHKDLVLWFGLLSLGMTAMIAGTFFSTTLLPRLFHGKLAQHRIFTSVMSLGYALAQSFKRPGSLWTAIGFGIVFWASSCLNYYAYANALDMHVPFYFYALAIPCVSLITFLPISINGFGVREGAFVYLFSTVHVPIATSLLLALLMDVQVLFFGAIGAALYLTMGSSRQTALHKAQAA